MPIKSAGALILVSCLAACSVSSVPNCLPKEIELKQDTRRIEGWFSAKGEWILFPTKSFRDYSPFGRDENQKCVSLVNGTGLERTRYQSLEGDRIVVTGFVVRYESLSSGDSVHDRLLSKKYFENEPVENFCLRDFIFVASSLEPVR